MLSTFSVKKPFTVLVAIVIIIVFGFIAFNKMTPDLFPKINTPYVIVMTTYPGASPEEAEIEITKPMEQQMATLTNIKNVTSISSANYSVIQLEFSDNVNMDAISVDIRDKIDQIKGNLPETAGTPVVMKINLDMVPVVTAAVGMNEMTPAAVSDFTRENLQNPLEGVEGVASLNTMGMVNDSIQIVLSQEKIDKVNENVSAAISDQFGTAKGQINSGINQANGGKSQISSGKNAIKNGQSQAAKQFAAARAQLQESKKQLENLKTQGPVLQGLLQQYDAAVASGNTVLATTIETQVNALGMTIDQLRKAVGQLANIDANIAAINAAIIELDAKQSATDFDLSSKYADLSAAESSIAATVNQLQGALADIQSSEDAALAASDMTGILTMQNVSAILSAQNFSMPAGYVTDGEAEMLVSVGNKVKSKEELENLVLMDMGIEGVAPITLSDIATVTYTDQSAETYAKINGENGVLMSFTKQSSYATAVVSENIESKFTQLESKYDNLEFTTLSDQGEYIHIVINSVLQNLLLGAVLAILVLLFFLRDIRPTFITAVSIPISVVFAIVLMYFSGVTLNMISLAGLAIGVGMLVDNSIVVIENTFRLRALGYSGIQAAVSGASQVAGAITASTLTTICVFAPIIFIDGMTKDIFVDLALTVTYSLIASLVIAMTLVPAMAKGMLKNKQSSDEKQQRGHIKKFFTSGNSVLNQNSKIIHNYKRLVSWSLYHKKLLIIGAFLLLIASSALCLSKGFEFMPSMSTPQISADIKMPEESTLEETSKTTDAVMKEVRKVDGVQTVGAMLSSDTMGMMGMTAAEQDVTATMLYIVLDEDKVKNGKLIVDKMDEMAKKYNCEITTSADMDMATMTGGSGVSINLIGEDLDQLRQTGIDIEKELHGMKELKDVSNIKEESSSELRVVVNKNAAMKEGLTVAQVYQQISANLAKDTVSTTLSKDNGTVDVVVQNTGSGKYTRKDLENMKLQAGSQSASAAQGSSMQSASESQSSGTKKEVKLSEIATVETGASLNAINHENQKRNIQVTAGIKDGYNVTHVTDQIKNKITNKKLVPSNVSIDYGGENKEIMDAMRQMMLMLLVGFLLVYLIMVAQFQSLRSPFIVIFTIPLAFTGGMLALLICGQVVSIVSMMGFVMLMGVVVNNAIVLVDCINRFRLEGMEMDEAIINAGAVRMRPVLMTAITTILGLIPLAIGIGTGSEMMQPLAIVCIGGLIYATLTTLVIIPIMYKKFAKKHMEKIKQEELEIVTV